MRLVVHVFSLLADTAHFAVVGRKIWVVLALLIGLLLIVAAATAQVAAPVLLYPFV